MNSTKRNPYRLNPESSEFRAWESGFNKDFLCVPQPHNPYTLFRPDLLPVYLAGEQARLDAEAVIPKGSYCYGENGTCPHWGKRKHVKGIIEKQTGGFCRLLRSGDWQGDSFSLLHDQVKECGIKKDYGQYQSPEEFTGELIMRYDVLQQKTFYSLISLKKELDILPDDTIVVKGLDGKDWEIFINGSGPEHTALPENLTIEKWQEIFNIGLNVKLLRDTA